jgi:hypothetical protein
VQNARQRVDADADTGARVLLRLIENFRPPAAKA